MGTVKQSMPVECAMPVGTAFPQLVSNAGTNFRVLGWAFDTSTEEAMALHWKVVGYGSGNVTVTIVWYADTASSGGVAWGCSLAAITPDIDSQDVETKAFATEVVGTDTHRGTTGQRLHTCAVEVNQLDSLAADDEVWLKIARKTGNAGDTMTGDAIVVGVTISYSDT